MGRAPLSPSGNPLTKFVNLWQTPEERRERYAYCRASGIDVCQSTRMRDWHDTKVELYLENFYKPTMDSLLAKHQKLKA